MIFIFSAFCTCELLKKWKLLSLDYFLLYYMVLSGFPFVSSNHFKWSSGILLLLNYRNAFLNVMKLRKIPQTAQDDHSFKDNSPWEITHRVVSTRHFLIPAVKTVYSLKSWEWLLFQYCMSIFFLECLCRFKIM